MERWGPGIRFFHCLNCEQAWEEKSRDCTSLSVVACPQCEENVTPHDYEFQAPSDWNSGLQKKRVLR